MFDKLFENAKNTECAKKHFENELSYHVGPYELNHLIHSCIEKINLVDVRDYEDYLEGHIPFAMHVPASALEDNLAMFEKNKLNILYCYKIECQLAKKCCLKLAKLGYPVVEGLGGYKSWKKSGFDVVKNSDEGF